MQEKNTEENQLPNGYAPNQRKLPHKKELYIKIVNITTSARQAAN